MKEPWETEGAGVATAAEPRETRGEPWDRPAAVEPWDRPAAVEPWDQPAAGGLLPFLAKAGQLIAGAVEAEGGGNAIPEQSAAGLGAHAGGDLGAGRPGQGGGVGLGEPGAETSGAGAPGQEAGPTSPTGLTGQPPPAIMSQGVLDRALDENVPPSAAERLGALASAQQPTRREEGIARRQMKTAAAAAAAPPEYGTHELLASIWGEGSLLGKLASAALSPETLRWQQDVAGSGQAGLGTRVAGGMLNMVSDLPVFIAAGGGPLAFAGVQAAKAAVDYAQKKATGKLYEGAVPEALARGVPVEQVRMDRENATLYHAVVDTGAAALMGKLWNSAPAVTARSFTGMVLKQFAAKGIAQEGLNLVSEVLKNPAALGKQEFWEGLGPRMAEGLVETLATFLPFEAQRIVGGDRTGERAMWENRAAEAERLGTAKSHLRDLVDRARAGDQAAKDELLKDYVGAGAAHEEPPAPVDALGQRMLGPARPADLPPEVRLGPPMTAGALPAWTPPERGAPPTVGPTFTDGMAAPLMDYLAQYLPPIVRLTPAERVARMRPEERLRLGNDWRALQDAAGVAGGGGQRSEVRGQPEAGKIATDPALEAGREGGEEIGRAEKSEIGKAEAAKLEGGAGPVQSEPPAALGKPAGAVKGPLTGAKGAGAWEAETPQREAKIAGDWVVADVRTPRASTEEGYPPEYQGRNFETQTSKDMIEKIARDPLPERMVEDPTTDGGAPNVDAAGNVISGNHRLVGVREAYERDTAARFKAEIVKKAAEMGLDASGIARPVLLRRITDTGGHPMEKIAEWSNRNAILQRTPAEIAEADAHGLVESGLVRAFDPDEAGKIRAASNRNFLKAFVQMTGDTSLVDSKGNFTEAIDGRVRRAMLAAVLGGGEQARPLIADLVERADTYGVQRQRDGIMQAAGNLRRATRGRPDYDLTADLARAIQDLVEYKKLLESGKVRNLDAYMAQGELLASGRTPESRELLQTLAKQGTSKAVAGVLNIYARRISEINQAQGDIFGVAPEPKGAILGRAINEQRGTQEQAAVTPGGAPKPQPETPAANGGDSGVQSQEPAPAVAAGGGEPAAPPGPAAEHRVAVLGDYRFEAVGDEITRIELKGKLVERPSAGLVKKARTALEAARLVAELRADAATLKGGGEPAFMVGPGPVRGRLESLAELPAPKDQTQAAATGQLRAVARNLLVEAEVERSQREMFGVDRAPKEATLFMGSGGEQDVGARIERAREARNAREEQHNDLSNADAGRDGAARTSRYEQAVAETYPRLDPRSQERWRQAGLRPDFGDTPRGAAIVRRAAASGLEVVFVGTGDPTVCGFIRGGRIFLNVRHPYATPDQIADHEIGHRRMAGGDPELAGLRQSARPSPRLEAAYRAGYKELGVNFSDEQLRAEIALDFSVGRTHCRGVPLTEAFPDIEAATRLVERYYAAGGKQPVSGQGEADARFMAGDEDRRRAMIEKAGRLLALKSEELGAPPDTALAKAVLGEWGTELAGHWEAVVNAAEGRGQRSEVRGQAEAEKTATDPASEAGQKGGEEIGKAGEVKPSVQPAGGGATSAADKASIEGKSWPGGPLGEKGEAVQAPKLNPADDPNFSVVAPGLPETVQFAKRLMNGDFPRVAEALRGNALGRMSGQGPAIKIKLRADIFRLVTPAEIGRLHEEAAAWAEKAQAADPEASLEELTKGKFKQLHDEALAEALNKNPLLALKVLWRGIFHGIDYVPDNTLSRGNILGHLKSYKGVWDKSMASLDGDPENLFTPRERARMRGDAGKEAREAVPRGTPDRAKLLAAKTAEIYAGKMQDAASQRGLVTKAEIVAEAEPLIAWWRGSGEKMEDYFRQPKEMYAEMGSILVNNPAAMAKRAPKFWAMWNVWLKEKPELAKQWVELQSGLRSGATRELAVADVRAGFEQSAQQLAMQEAAMLSRTPREWVDGVMNTLFRGSWAVTSRARGESLESYYKVRDATQGFNYRHCTERAYLLRVANEVLPYLRDNNVAWPDFLEFLLHQRNIAEPGKAISGGFAPNDSTARLAEKKRDLGSARYKAMEDAAAAFRKARQEEVINLLRETGTLRPEQLAEMEAKEAYVTLQAMRGATVSKERAAAAMKHLDVEMLMGKWWGPTFKGNRMYQRIGFLGPVVDPVLATLRNDMTWINLAMRTRALRTVAEELSKGPDAGEWQTADEHWNGRYMVPDEPKSSRMALYSYLQDGEWVHWHVPVDLANCIRAESSHSLEILMALSRGISTPLKNLFTRLSPGFSHIALPMRNAWSFYMQMPGAKLFGPQSYLHYRAEARASAKMIRAGTPDADALAMLRRGLQPTYFGRHTQPEGMALEEFARRMGVDMRLSKEVDSAFDGWRAKLSKELETIDVNHAAFKIAGMRYMDEHFPDMPQAEKDVRIRDAAGAAAYGDKPNIGSEIPFLSVFYNACFRHGEAFWDAWRSPRTGRPMSNGETWFKLLKWVALPGLVAAAARRKDLFGEEYGAMCRAIPRYDWDTKPCIPLFWVDKAAGKVFFLKGYRDPISQSIAHAWSVILRVLPGPNQDTDAGAIGALASFGGDLPSGQPLWQVGSAWAQYLQHGTAPIDPHTGSPIMTETQARAGDRGIISQAGGQLGMYSWNTLGLSAIARLHLNNYQEPVKSRLERILALPLISSTLGRIAAVSNMGDREKALMIERANAVQSARAALLREQIIRQAVSGAPADPALLNRLVLIDPAALPALAGNLRAARIKAAVPNPIAAEMLRPGQSRANRAALGAELMQRGQAPWVPARTNAMPRVP